MAINSASFAATRMTEEDAAVCRAGFRSARCAMAAYWCSPLSHVANDNEYRRRFQARPTNKGSGMNIGIFEPLMREVVTRAVRTAFDTAQFPLPIRAQRNTLTTPKVSDHSAQGWTRLCGLPWE